MLTMKTCEKCGEQYSPTYKKCPFCQEEAALKRGKPIRRRAADYRNKKGGHSLGVLALVAVLILVGWGAGKIWGDDIAHFLGIRETTVVDQADDQDGDGITGVENPNPNSGWEDEEDDPAVMPDGTGTDSGSADTGNPDQGAENVAPPVTEITPPATAVSLSSNDFTLFKAGESTKLKVNGGGENYTWSVDKTLVAKVDGSGAEVTVTAVGGGVATVTVSDGFTSATCTVRVRGAAASGSENTGTAAPSGSVKLNREDMTLSKGESFRLKASGTSSAVTWSIADTSVATISDDGTVKGIANGTTTVTANVDGQSIKCIVRVK